MRLSTIIGRLLVCSAACAANSFAAPDSGLVIPEVPRDENPFAKRIAALCAAADIAAKTPAKDKPKTITDFETEIGKAPILARGTRPRASDVAGACQALLNWQLAFPVTKEQIEILYVAATPETSDKAMILWRSRIAAKAPTDSRFALMLNQHLAST